MITVEQKINLVMQYVIAEDDNEKNRLRDEIRYALSSTDPVIAPETAIDIPSPEYDGLMDNIIDDLFREIGCPCHLCGYDQAAYAIKLCISDPHYLRDITYGLYPDVAKEFNTTRTRTERAIRHLVESAWNRHDIQDAYRVFGNTIDINKGKPTNSQFIASCVRVVKRRMRDGK